MPELCHDPSMNTETLKNGDLGKVENILDLGEANLVTYFLRTGLLHLESKIAFKANQVLILWAKKLCPQ